MRSLSMVTLATDSANDRVTQRYFDADGIAQGRGGRRGGVTNYRYDQAGQLVETIRHAQQAELPSPASNHARSLGSGSSPVIQGGRGFFAGLPQACSPNSDGVP